MSFERDYLHKYLRRKKGTSYLEKINFSYLSIEFVLCSVTVNLFLKIHTNMNCLVTRPF